MKSIVSLEVGSDAIRAAEIAAPLSKNPRVLNLGEIAIPPGTAKESILDNREVYMEKLKELWEQENFKTKNVAITVSGRRFLIREHETGYNSLKDLKSVLPMDAAGVVPEGMHDPILDFYPTHHVDSKEGSRTGGLVIATPAEYIETLVYATADAGFHVEFVDFAPMAIARFIRNQIDPNTSYVLANIREESTDIVVAKNGVPRLVRATPNGLEPIKRQIGRVQTDTSSIKSYNESFAQDSPMVKLAREIRVTTMSFYEEMNMDGPSKLYLTGPRSSDSELVRTLEDILKVDVTSLHQNVEIPKDKELDDEMSASDFVAICGGMRGKK